MRCLVVEDEFTSRLILQRILSTHGECHVAVDGHEAIEAFEMALEADVPYDLVLLDILLPSLDGHSVLARIRELEAARGIALGRGAKVVMISGLEDKKTVFTAFRSGCESYLVKPVNKEKVLRELSKLGLVDRKSA